MKIKLFYQKHKQSLEEFENQVNDFIAGVEVVDVKYTEATSGDYEAMKLLKSLDKENDYTALWQYASR